MNKQTLSPSIEALNELIIDAIQDVKGKNVLKLDLRKLESAPAEYFIICEGDSSTQIKAISRKIYRKLKDELNILPNHMEEGKEEGKWILVDYFNTIIHVFHPESRRFYELEDLWSDAEFTEYENL